jgi:hypothetical protein
MAATGNSSMIFRYQSIRNKNLLWRPCLLTDQDEISNFYRGPSIDASHQVSVHLAKQFQRRRFLKIDQLKKAFPKNWIDILKTESSVKSIVNIKKDYFIWNNQFINLSTLSNYK